MTRPAYALRSDPLTRSQYWNAWAAAVEHVRSKYPEDVFPNDGVSVDAQAARWGFPSPNSWAKANMRNGYRSLLETSA